ncbi:DMT family transporter [Sphingomonas sp. RHCKR7]|uniref:DMT family transporter n=1 Tax=Sphingomonas folli TaxID=2862497 RepID=UPI001C6666C3|nr:DMT family transporter [Sphingomonas folli]MBW6526644.1 DMT family transporter [Sphingomonas folli]
MPSFLPLLLVILAGVGVAVQPPTNAALAKAGGSVWLAALVSFACGVAVLLTVWATADRTPLASLRGAPWWAWFGGLYGAAFVAALAFATPRLGLAVTLTIAVASQLVTALVIDRFGWLGLPQQPLSPARLGGVALVLAGALLMRRG